MINNDNGQNLLDNKARKSAIRETDKLSAFRLENQRAIRCFRGKLNWDGDLEVMRTNIDK